MYLELAQSPEATLARSLESLERASAVYLPVTAST